MHNEKPLLSEADRKAIVNGLYSKFKSEIFLNTGKGVINLVTKLFLLGIFGLALVGFSKGWFG